MGAVEILTPGIRRQKTRRQYPEKPGLRRLGAPKEQNFLREMREDFRNFIRAW